MVRRQRSRTCYNRNGETARQIIVRTELSPPAQQASRPRNSVQLYDLRYPRRLIPDASEHTANPGTCVLLVDHLSQGRWKCITKVRKNRG